MIAAVIPTRYRPPELAPLMRVLEVDGVTMFLLESVDFDHHIYAMWNAGVTRARQLGASEIAVLNDDVTILPGTLPALRDALRSEPDVAVVYPDINAAGEVRPWGLQDTTGTWGAGGMTGFCFMFRAELTLPGFDESYGWWYGDDAWEAAVRARGHRVCRVRGVPVTHTPNGSASRRWDELGPIVAADRVRWEAAHV